MTAETVDISVGAKDDGVIASGRYVHSAAGQLHLDRTPAYHNVSNAQLAVAVASERENVSALSQHNCALTESKSTISRVARIYVLGRME